MKNVSRGFTIIKASILTSFLLLSLLVFPVSKAEAAGAIIPKSFFLEHPYSITAVSANGEWVDLDDDGSLWMNSYRVDVNLYQNLFGVYGEFPFAGVTSFGPSDDDDYDFGNIGVGGKFVLLNLDSSVLTTGFEVILPTASDDVGALAAQRYFREFASFVDEAYTLKPYLVFGASSGIFAVQANLDFDILLNADDLEGDDTELIIKYGGTASLTPELNLPFSTSLLVELLAASSTTFDDNVTGVYLTPGLRLGGQTVSVGAGVEIPFGSDEISDFANVGVVIDLIFRFGS